MAPIPGLTFELDPRAGALLATHLAHRGGRALEAGGCTLELIADDPPWARRLHAIISWEHAVPLKVERLAVALTAAGATLCRDLDPEALRLRARAAGHTIVRVASVADLERFRRTMPGLTLLPQVGLPPESSLAG